MSNRTDVHTPSRIVPSDYREVAVWTMNIQGLGDAEFMLRERETVRRDMEHTKGEYAHVDTTGSCQVCGNVQAIYLVLFHHAPSNTYVRVGMDCAAKLGMSGDAGKWNLFRRNVQTAREAQAGKRKAIALLGDAGLSAAWDVYTAPMCAHLDGCKAAGRNQFGDDNGVENACTCDFEARWKIRNYYEELTITDIVGKLVKYGSISEAQTNFVRRLLAKIEQRPIVEAQRAAEKEAAGPVPSGRVELHGKVVGTKEVENRWGYQGDSDTRTMLIIQLDNGSKVYGSRFAGLNRGDEVSFKATVTPSQNDPKFGFYKRPNQLKS